MTMKRSASFCLALLLLSASAESSAVQILNGALTTSDLLATDSTAKTFYYDLFEISNPTAFGTSVTITIDAGLNLRPWSAYWTSSLLPAVNWESPSDLYSVAAETRSSLTQGASLVFTTFTLPAATTYQLAVATSDYNEDGALLDIYTLSVEGDGLSISAVPVPEPGVLALLALLPLALWRRLSCVR